MIHLMTLLRSIVTLFIGTYTGAGSEGFYALHFDQNTGTFLTDKMVCAPMTNPSFLTLGPRNLIYAVSETAEEEARLYTWQWDPKTWTLTPLAQAPTLGADPCHVATNGSLAAVSNYSGGSLSLFTLSPEGLATAKPLSLPGATGGPDRERQGSPHVHCALFTPEGRFLLASDFSADRLIRYRMDTGQTQYVPLPAHTAPRHLVFSPKGRQLYVLGELSGAVTVLDYDPATGQLSPRQTLPADQVQARGAADIHLTPDGRYLYASLRLRNEGLARFRVAKDGSLTYLGQTPTGAHPRNFAITPNGRYLLCACRDHNRVEVYAIDKKTGDLRKQAASLSLSKPVCLQWGR